MMGERTVAQEALFYEFSIERHVPADHLLRSIDRFVDLTGIRDQLRPFYSEGGRPSVDPELMIRMLIIGYTHGIRSERRLCEEVHLNLAYRWFCRPGLDGNVPDHSTFSKNRHGRFRDSDLLRRLFEATVQRCIAEGLVGCFALRISPVDAARRLHWLAGSHGRRCALRGDDALWAHDARRAAVCRRRRTACRPFPGRAVPVGRFPGVVLMVAAKKTRKPLAPAPAVAVAQAPVPLKAFYDGGGQHPEFGFARFYFASPGQPRESIVAKILKKRRPAGAEATDDTAAKVEALVTRDAPQDYADPDFLVRRYEEKLSSEETTAYAQVTLRFDGDILNLHHPWEVARSWLRSYYVDHDRGVPVVAILHAPHLAGSDNLVHCHAILLPKRLTRFGWGSMQRELTSDEGHRDAFASWQAYKGEHL